MADLAHLGPLFELPTQEKLDKLELAWKECRARNPRLMPALLELCLQARRRGFTHWSADALFHVLRWETGLTTNDCGLKINNNYTALAARDLMREHPELEGLFQLRERRPRGIESQVH